MVSVHCHPAKGLWHAAVMSTLKDLGVSRDEFDAWLRAGRKARPEASNRKERQG
jgi:hypothetical protein